MTLEKRQRAELDQYAEMARKSPDVIRIQVQVGRRRAYTREFGSGIAVTITVYKCYEEDEYRLTGSWIADCAYEDTAIEKAQDIARYLVAMGCPKECIRVKER